MVWSVLVLVVGIPGSIVLQSTGLFLACFFVCLALGMAGAIVHLFGVAQMSLSELLILIAVLGNLLGWMYSVMVMEGNGLGRDERHYTFALSAVGVVLGVVGGASRGLWLAKALNVQNILSRLGLMALGILYPASFIAIPFALIYLCVVNGIEYKLAGALVLASCSVVLITMQRLRKSIRRDPFKL